MEPTIKSYVIGILNRELTNIVVVPMWKVVEIYAIQKGVSHCQAADLLAEWICKYNKPTWWARKLVLCSPTGAIIGYITPVIDDIKHYCINEV